MHTQADAEALAALRRMRRRSVTVEVEVSTYADATVYLDRIDTADLLDELRSRGESADEAESVELEDGYALYTLQTATLRRIRHLFLLGREVEASEQCRQLIADMLGTAI